MTRLIDAKDRYIIHRTNNAAKELITHWHVHQTTMSAAHKAAGALLVHCTNCWNGICKLLDNCATVHEMDMLSNSAACILRSMHDAAIQLEYILKGDSKKALTPDQLGQLYLDFEIVERYKSISRLDSFTSNLAKRLAGSPRRTAAEPALKREYERVKANYARTSHWYPGSLSDIATVIGREEEHFWLLSLYNSSVHGGPSAVFHGPIPAGADLCLIAMNILARAGSVLMKPIGANLTSQSSELFEAEADLLNLPHKADIVTPP